MYTFSSAKKICISFDWHHDRTYRNLLSAWNANSSNPLSFDDLTPGEIDTDDVGRVKAVLTTKIRAATHTLVLVGAHANSKHADSEKIGTRNWIWWEIAQSIAEKNKLIAVKLDKEYVAPDSLYSAGTKWAYSFTLDAIVKAINGAG